MPRWDTPETDPPWKEQQGQQPRRDPARPEPAQDTPVPRPDDLYARWAEATQWRGFARDNPQHAGRRADDPPQAVAAYFDICIIAKAPSPETLAKALSKETTWLAIPDLYRQPLPGANGRWSLYFTATVKRVDLPTLYLNELGLEWELAMPRHRPQPVAQATTAGRFGPEREEEILTPQAVLKDRLSQAPRTRAGSIPSAIAIVDFGCPFLNQRFAGAGKTSRVATLWDQGSRPAVGHWWTDCPSSTGYGRELNRVAIDAIVRQVNSITPPLDEAATYRSLDYLIAYDDPRRRAWFATHGAHVMDMAAGKPDPLADLCCLEPDDAAGDADIIFVQLPALTAADSSGGSLSAHLLDAVRYAMHVCADDAKLVVNISYGSFAGPHDGSSLIEAALDNLLELRRDNFAIVLAAGNARQAGCHVRRTVRDRKSALLRMAITPNDTTDTFLELWYPRPDASHAALAVRVRTADRDWSPWIAGGDEVVLRDEATREPLALLQHRHLVPNGARAMVLLALAPTAGAINDVGPINDPGLWEIEVGLAKGASADVTFDAWIERDDPGDGGGLGGAAQPSFLGLDRDDERNTLSSIATGAHTIVVSGYRWRDGSIASYSSLPEDGLGRGPKATPLPLLLAPCEEDALQPNLQAAAVRSIDTHRMNGTSVAAPVVARRVFNLLADPALKVESWAVRLRRLIAESEGVIRPAQD